MKQSPELQHIQDNMQPGILSAEGFLGYDTRNLSDILAEDSSTVERLGITDKAIAERMRYFTEKGKSGLGNPVVVNQIFQVTVEDHRGFIPCPFSDNFSAEKRNTRVVNLITNRSVQWSDLNVHMIEKHGFYEGNGSFFRIEPAEVVEVLMVI